MQENNRVTIKRPKYKTGQPYLTAIMQAGKNSVSAINYTDWTLNACDKGWRMLARDENPDGDTEVWELTSESEGCEL